MLQPLHFISWIATYPLFEQPGPHWSTKRRDVMGRPFVGLLYHTLHLLVLKTSVTYGTFKVIA